MWKGNNDADLREIQGKWLEILPGGGVMFSILQISVYRITVLAVVRRKAEWGYKQ
jgi:hypothetical protein